MSYNKNKEIETVQKTLRIPKPICDKIEDMAIENERDFSKQVNYMLKEYIRIKES